MWPRSTPPVSGSPSSTTWAALGRPRGPRALDWLASRQRPDGCWEEDAALAAAAPPWAKPGDPEARFYLTANAAYWLTVAAADAVEVAAATTTPHASSASRPAVRGRTGPRREAIRGSSRPDGTWPGFLVSGWLAAAVLHRREMVLRVGPHAGGARRAGAEDVCRRTRLRWRPPCAGRAYAPTTALLVTARRRLAETQRSDGAWPSDDGEAFDVHTALAAIRACL